MLHRVWESHQLCCYYTVKYDMAYITAVTGAEHKSRFEPTTYIPYLTLTGELWDVFYENLRENLSHYKIIKAPYCNWCKMLEDLINNFDVMDESDVMWLQFKACFWQIVYILSLAQGQGVPMRSNVTWLSLENLLPGVVLQHTAVI